MSGITILTDQLICIKLLTLTLEVQNSISQVKEHIMLAETYTGGQDYSWPTRARTDDGLHTLADFCKNFEDRWDEQLIGPAVYSSNPRFQVIIVSNIIQSVAGPGLILQNQVRDIPPHKINASLLGFILHQLLSIIIIFSREENLILRSDFDNKKLSVAILGIKHKTFKGIGEGLSERNKNLHPTESADLAADSRLSICYNILSRYGGNLWSDSSGNGGGNVYFSIPLLKSLDQ